MQQGEMQVRSMATIKQIADVKPINGADRICAYKVDSWWVVDTVGKYAVGDLVVMVEIDAWVPHELAPFLGRGSEPKSYNNVLGYRLRTVKLRGQISQGLLLPASVLDQMQVTADNIGLDVSDRLNIQKYEPPVPAQLAGVALGLFPSYVRRSDQERIQNLTKEYAEWTSGEWQPHGFEVTEKLDGSSMTVIWNNGYSGVCSRNLELRDTEGNTLWAVTHRDQLIEKLKSLGRNLALQGEIVGNGIQGNKYKLNQHKFYVYNIYDIDNGTYLLPEARRQLCAELNIDHVPVIHTNLVPGELGYTIEDILDLADGNSSLVEEPVLREGLVFKSLINSDIQFKAISNKWLMKNE